ncbi:uncharacterized protein [Haliotis cracherodii]|uniref:uncharacterized protein n=1 Tax=Haliotis cracherodii TaxID=6455 RepID=UPI0039EBD707
MTVFVNGQMFQTVPDVALKNSGNPVYNPVLLNRSTPVTGNNVTIVMAGQFLALCEVQVLVCGDGWFGNDCEHQCQCRDSSEVCDKQSGYCSSGCAVGRYGDGCLGSCHCNETCDNFPGAACSTQAGTVCKLHWFGPYCQMENIAYGKTADQSSTYNESVTLYNASLAVDGNSDTNFIAKSCSHTNGSETASWHVILDTKLIFNISRIRIYLRDDVFDKSHSNDMDVIVSGQLCQHFERSSYVTGATLKENPLDVTCSPPIRGRNVTIAMYAPFLSLCEVQVFVCGDGWFGNDCEHQCQCRDSSEVCDKQSGYCSSGCAVGRYGDGCLVCSDGWFGNDCEHQCQCRDSSEVCDKQSGYCSSGCAVGRYGDGCQSICHDSWFGTNCTKKCKCNNITEVCDKANGNCRSGCLAGKRGSGCQDDCASGQYGFNCSFACGHCNDVASCRKDDGNCTSGCEDGYSPPFCKDCENGRFGGNCTEHCHCRNKSEICEKTSGSCGSGCIEGKQGEGCQEECQHGTYGEDCLQVCGACSTGVTCNHTSGVCETGCLPHHQEPYCKVCHDSWFGTNCTKKCKCNNITEVCDKVNGNCRSGCLAGKRGSGCQDDCASGQYGFNCSFTCGHCSDVASCRKDDGNCTRGCKVGYSPPLCNDCENGRFGRSCSEHCHCRNKSEICEKTSGSCGSGCIEGKQGEGCQEVAQQSNALGPQSMIGVIVGVVIAVLLVAALVVVLIYIRRRSTQNSHKEDQPEEDITESSFSAGSSERTASTSMKSTKPVKPPKKPKPPADNVYENSDHYYNVLPAPVRLDRLMQYVREKVTGMGFEHEYKLLRHGLNGEHTEGKKPENKKRNRFLALFPYDASRVVLSPDGDATCDYIHASYVQGFHETSVFIAAQGPNNVTVDDFWRMIWQENVSQIVMLTRVMELNRKKCEQYWPDGTKEKKCGNILIKPLLSTVRADFTTRKFLVQHSNKPSDKRTVTQLHFTSWPDHDVPSAPALVGFWKQYRSLTSSEEDITGPVVVHCSAGVGRTGTFIALDNLFDEAESLNKVNVFACVSKMREARINMVQTVEQYRFVHESVMEAIASRGTFYTLSDFEKKFGTEVKYTRQQEMEMNKQFQSLESMKMEIPGKLASDAYLPDNISKNRNKDIVPANRVRPFLSTPVADHNDYINAVVLPSATQPLGLLATQTPLTQTVVDFWRLVYDHDCFTIVCLEDNQALYPRQNETLNIGPFRITTLQVDASRDSFTVMQLNLALREQDNTHQQIRVFKLRSQIPGPPEPFLDFVNEVGTKGSSEEHRTLVHCPDGARLCGVFCSVLNIISRLRLDKEVDIYLTIRELQCIRPQFIESYDQYKFCYGMVKEYLRDSSVYANL